MENRSWNAALACLVAAAVAMGVASDAGAAVLCQRKNKVKLRVDGCKGKETPVQDLQQLDGNVQALGANVQQLGTDLATQNGVLGGQVARVDGIVGQLRLECENAPELVQATSRHSFYYDNIECGGGCRTHDGDEAACESAWAVSRNGATSCFYFKDFCLPCEECGENVGVCTNACREQVNVSCPNDPTRTVFAGGPGSSACRRFETQEECEQAFHAGSNLDPASCYWTGSQCRGCGPDNENEEECTNTCRTKGCADPSRTTLKQCNEVGNDATACGQTWHLSGNGVGEPASCFFDATAMICKGCGLPNELRGLCDNECR